MKERGANEPGAALTAAVRNGGVLRKGQQSWILVAEQPQIGIAPDNGAQ